MAKRVVVLLKRLSPYYNSIENLFVNIGLVALFLMMVLITANAVGRHLFDSPIPGVIQSMELYFMIAIVFLLAAPLQREERNINVDVLSSRLPELVSGLSQLTVRALTAIIFLVISIEATGRAIEAYTLGWETIGRVPFPLFLSWTIMAVGLWFFCFRLGIQIIDDVTDLVRTRREANS